MIQAWRFAKRLGMVLLLLGLMLPGMLLVAPAWCQTYVSGKVLTADGMAVASGAVALEKGQLHIDLNGRRANQSLQKVYQKTERIT